MVEVGMEFFHLHVAEFAFRPAFQLNRSAKKIERREKSLQVFRGDCARQQGTLNRRESESAMSLILNASTVEIFAENSMRERGVTMRRFFTSDAVAVWRRAPEKCESVKPSREETNEIFLMDALCS